jgi:hypothetical protein
MRPSVSRLIAYISAFGVRLTAVFEAGPEKEPEAAVEQGRLRR